MGLPARVWKRLRESRRRSSAVSAISIGSVPATILRAHARGMHDSYAHKLGPPVADRDRSRGGSGCLEHYNTFNITFLKKLQVALKGLPDMMSAWEGGEGSWKS